VRGSACRLRFPGVSYVPKRRLWQAQVTVSDKVHLGNFVDQDEAGYAVSLAKARLRGHGFTVKLQDGEAEPKLTKESRQATETRVNNTLSHFEGKWRDLLGASDSASRPGSDAPAGRESLKRARTQSESDAGRPAAKESQSRRVAVVCEVADAQCLERGSYVASRLSAAGDEAALVCPADGGWQVQYPGGVWQGLRVEGVSGIERTFDIVIHVRA
jgi:hypothetical protein